MTIATGLMDFAALWGVIGAVVALIFLTIGVDRIDEDARGAYIFRPLIAPGVILLWPLVLWRWWVLETGNDVWALRHAPPRRAHGRVWIVLAVVIALIFIASLVLRQTWPAEFEPVRIAPAVGATQ